MSTSGCKDPSALYLENPGQFLAHWEAALQAAVSWSAEVQAECDQAAQEAYALAEELLTDAQLLDRISEVMRERGYAGDLNPPRLAYIAMTSRLLERPLNVAFVSPSAAGKNRTVDAAVELMPSEALYIEK